MNHAIREVNTPQRLRQRPEGIECTVQWGMSKCIVKWGISKCIEQWAISKCIVKWGISKCIEQWAISKCIVQWGISKCIVQWGISKCFRGVSLFLHKFSQVFICHVYVFLYPPYPKNRGYFHDEAARHLRKHWRATAYCGKSKFAISSGYT